MRNHLCTFTLLAALTALFVGVGYAIGGPGGMLIALVLAAGMNLVSYWNADKIVLSMYRAQPVDEGAADPLIRAFAADVRELASRAGLPPPKVYVIDRTSRTPSPPAATRPTPPSPPPAASCGCSTGARSAASWPTSWRT
jgi:heat shock protein HtpX